MTRHGMSLADRFHAKLDKSGDCWIWTGGTNGFGYGRWTIERGRTVATHRFAYESFVGPIPDGLTIDHLCRVRLCANPDHLEAVTHAENLARIPERTHCPSGHEFTPENTYLYERAPGRVSKHCRTCNRERGRRNFAAFKAAQAAAARPAEQSQETAA